MCVCILASMSAQEDRRETREILPSSSAVGAAVIAGVFLMALLTIHTESFFGDEGFHMAQLERFLAGNFSIHGELTMLPGYHAILFAAAWGTNLHSLNFFRFVTLIISLLSVAIFRAILRQTSTPWSGTRTLQYAFLPILFPFFILVYTDVASILFILLALFLHVRRQYALAALAGIVSMFMRQNNIVWLFFFFLLFIAEEWPCIIKMLPKPLRLLPRMRELRQKFTCRVRPPAFILAASVFALGALLFIAFVLWNHGIAIGDKSAHPFPAVHTGNIFFALFLSFFLFLPLHLRNVPDIVRGLRRSRFLWPAIVVLFLLYMLTFKNDHGYNQGWDSVFIRNRILMYMTGVAWLKAMAFVAIAWAFVSFSVTTLARRSYWLLYPITILYLLPSWLIEQRYYCIPFALFLLFRKSRSQAFETWFAGYGVVCTILLFIPIALRWFFL